MTPIIETYSLYKQVCVECEPDCPCYAELEGERCYDSCSMCGVGCPCRNRRPEDGE
jgi:hypothetical protein